MKGSYIKGFGTDYNAHRKLQRQLDNEKNRVKGTVVYKSGFAFVVPEEHHYLKGTIKRSIFNLIRTGSIESAMKLNELGVIIVRAEMGEAIAI